MDTVSGRSAPQPDDGLPVIERSVVATGTGPWNAGRDRSSGRRAVGTSWKFRVRGGEGCPGWLAGNRPCSSSSTGRQAGRLPAALRSRHTGSMLATNILVTNILRLACGRHDGGCWA